MAQVLEGTSWLCTALVLMGALGKLVSQDKTVQFVQALVLLTLLASGAASLLDARWDLEVPQAQAQQTQGELQEFLNSQYESATEEEAVRTLEGLLGAAGLTAKKIHVSITSSPDSGIVLARVSAAFRYPVEAERANALLRGVLGDDVAIEVTVDGA